MSEMPSKKQQKGTSKPPTKTQTTPDAKSEPIPLPALANLRWYLVQSPLECPPSPGQSTEIQAQQIAAPAS